ncbi:hypothetical protein IWX46DRAFT_603261 [Phyllosticta citricarpa]|uniref:Uncharacterized protein n=1 Tax=Phyllosticta citricarpa TaxID=55181 RepID=A0ABR1M8Z5_9PEZI
MKSRRLSLTTKTAATRLQDPASLKMGESAWCCQEENRGTWMLSRNTTETKENWRGFLITPLQLPARRAIMKTTRLFATNLQSLTRRMMMKALRSFATVPQSLTRRVMKTLMIMCGTTRIRRLTKKTMSTTSSGPSTTTTKWRVCTRMTILTTWSKILETWRLMKMRTAKTPSITMTAPILTKTTKPSGPSTPRTRWRVFIKKTPKRPKTLRWTKETT